MRAKPDYDHVFAQPDVRERCHPFTLLARLRAPADPANDVEPRLGLVVGRRHARRSVDRSRIKRHIREAFRHAAGDLPALDLIVLARPGSARVPDAALRNNLATLFERLVNRACSERAAEYGESR